MNTVQSGGYPRIAPFIDGQWIRDRPSWSEVPYAFTNSLERAERLAREIDTGVVSINNFGTPGPHHPFGGVKDSGFGREGGESALDVWAPVSANFARMSWTATPEKFRDYLSKDLTETATLVHTLNIPKE